LLEELLILLYQGVLGYFEAALTLLGYELVDYFVS
jgi:hypothetical protein